MNLLVLRSRFDVGFFFRRVHLSVGGYRLNDPCVATNYRSATYDRIAPKDGGVGVDDAVGLYIGVTFFVAQRFTVVVER